MLLVGSPRERENVKETYYVRRSVDGHATHNLEELYTIMSTPRRLDALNDAAECSILNNGYYYYVYKNGTEIAMFFVKEED